MCGIAGILHFDGLADAPQRVMRMTESIRHRGPDDDGFWSDRDVSLGFRRLSILDLETGAQPMSNEDGAVQVIFNGEIYNHRALRSELETCGHVFRSNHSDTEVLVHGYEQWGTALPSRLNGMFALAVWDSRKRTMFLARDRLGIKPIYLADFPCGIAFASEIRALLRSGLIEQKADGERVFEYFQQQNVWAGRSMFSGIRLLEPGSSLRIEPGRRQQTKFWNVAFARRNQPMAQAAGAIREVIQAALARQAAADVPVMAYLSGGIDSSAIVAGAYRMDRGLRAYSCIFDLEEVGDDRGVDEREFSRSVAHYLGVEHIELELPAESLRCSLAATIAALEEPRMGMAYVNYRIAARVSRDSKVVLSGCGGDEILAGYVGRYGVAKDRVAMLSRSTGPTGWLRSLLSAPKPTRETIREAILPMFSYPLLDSELDQAFTPDFRRIAGDYRTRDGLDELVRECPSDSAWDVLMYADLKTYLHGLLMVEDKVSMAHGLETRVPLLDNEIIDLALSFGIDLLTDGVTGKIAFREAIRDWVPPEIADKPKMGFGPPDASWYRGRLQPFVRRVLDPTRIARRGVFQPSFIANAIDDHMSKRANRLPLIWSMLSFEAWCESFNVFGGDLGDACTQYQALT
jgi:asparagine synthase (glutamine-hydrolysing)